MKQSERIENASFLVNHMAHQSHMTPAFKSAAELFEQELAYYDGPAREPSRKELGKLYEGIDDDFLYEFYVKGFTFKKFCDTLANELYNILDAGINEHCNRGANFETYNEWCDFVNNFGAAKFSKLLQKNLLTRCAVYSFVSSYDQEMLEIGSGDALWGFVDGYSKSFRNSTTRLN